MADRAPRPDRIVPLGDVPEESDEELARLAEITPEDIEDAKMAWRRDASPRYRNLLDAEVDEPERM